MAGDGREAIDENEILLRCIPQGFMSREQPPRVLRDAFLPKSRDVDGLSLFRAKYESPESASALLRGPVYYVAQLNAAALISLGLILEAKPSASSHGHAVIANMNAANRHSDQVQVWAKRITDSLDHGSIYGPFRK